MKNWGYWTKEKCREDALRFNSKSAWKLESKHAYDKSRINGWLPELTAHMKPKKKPNGYWIKEKIMEDAKRFDRPSDWERESPSAPVIAGRNGWLEEATAHMDKTLMRSKNPFGKSFKHPHNPLFLEGLKNCFKCKITKKLSEFYPSKRTKDGARPFCIDCQLGTPDNWKKNNIERVRMQDNERRKKKPHQYKNSQLRSTYGINLEDFEDFLRQQDGKCAICKIDQKDFKKRMSVDHDHKTGLIRGLLCDKCNRGLGHFSDSQDLMLKAIEYLNNNRSTDTTWQKNRPVAKRKRRK